MTDSYNSFNNSSSLRNSPAIKERVSLISVLMYQQFCEYQHSNENTSEIFAHIVESSKDFIEIIKQSFAARSVATENIWVKIDPKVPAVTVNILWNTYSFTMRCNFKPQAYSGENKSSFISGGIMAIKGDYSKLISGAKNSDEEMAILLENEIASIYVPENKMQNVILKAKHRANKEFQLTQLDAGREFMLLVSESVCGSPMYHEEGSRKSFNI